MFSRSCEYALIRWMLLCVGLGSFLLLYNEIEPSRSQLIVQEVRIHVVILVNCVGVYVS